jgi:hypothetical protein
MTERDKDASYYERRARDLGLPTDPEAYQDGGLGVAATGATQVEAEMIAAVLKEAGIPAWVEAPNSNLLYGAANYGFFPAGPRVLVPMGRMADAEKVIAEHAARLRGTEAEALADEAEMAAEAEAEPLRESPETEVASAGAQPGLIILIILAATLLVPLLVFAIATSPLAGMLAVTLTLLGSLAIWRSLRRRQPEGAATAAEVPAEAPSGREPGEPRHRRAVKAVGVYFLLVGLVELVFPPWGLIAGPASRWTFGFAQVLVIGACLLLGGGFVVLGIKILFRRKG